MGRSPEDIRRDMAGTRQAAGDTATQLAQQFDVGQRAQKAAHDIAETTQRQPMQALAAAAAVGFVAGRLTKRRKRR